MGRSRAEGSPERTAESHDQSLGILFVVGHPAHVHLFREAIDELEARGHRTFVASREKDLTTDLLDAYGIEHHLISTAGTGVFGLASELVQREVRLFSLARSFDPDVIVGILSPPAAHVATLQGRRNVAFTDSEPSRLAEIGARPFASRICTPARFGHDLGRGHRRYDGYHELAYLHPDRFEPDPEQLRSHGVDPESTYSVLRFVSWQAHHDIGRSGLSRTAKRRLVEELSEHGEVYITSESPLPSWFEPYRLPVPPESIHHLLSYADLYVGDSATMATEAAVLGTPAVRASSFAGDDDMSNFHELEEYGLLRSVRDGDRAIRIATELLADPEAGERWERRRDRLLDDKIDVTAFITDVIEQEGYSRRQS